MSTPHADHLYSPGTGDGGEGRRFWLEQVLRLGNIPHGPRVLDLGCGTGVLTTALAEGSAVRVWGLDSARRELGQGVSTDRGRRVGWIEGESSALPFRDASLDLVLLNFAIHLLPHPLAALAECLRVLRPSGILLVITLSHKELRRSLEACFPGALAIDRKRFPTIPTLVRTLRQAGFTGVHAYFLPVPGRPISVERCVEMAHARRIPALSLVPEEKLQRGLAVFERRLREHFGDTVPWFPRHTFVVGTRPFF